MQIVFDFINIRSAAAMITLGKLEPYNEVGKGVQPPTLFLMSLVKIKLKKLIQDKYCEKELFSNYF